MRVQKPREIAARILQQRRKAADYVENLLETELPKLSPADRGLCQELVCGVVRWQRTLDWLIARKTGSRTQKETLQILLRLVDSGDILEGHPPVRLGQKLGARFAEAERLAAGALHLP